jgi:hypothetical protein
MSDDLGNPGEPVAEVDPDDLKTFWQEVRNLQARHPSQHIGISFEVMKAIYKPGSNVQAIWFRSTMIWALNRSVQGSRMKRFRMLSSERWRRSRWNGSDTLSEKACPSTLKSSSAD